MSRLDWPAVTAMVIVVAALVAALVRPQIWPAAVCASLVGVTLAILSLRR